MTSRVLIDPQVFIIGYSETESDEGRVLQALHNRQDTVLLLSSVLEEQILRVARRVCNKD